MTLVASHPRGAPASMEPVLRLCNCLQNVLCTWGVWGLSRVLVLLRQEVRNLPHLVGKKKGMAGRCKSREEKYHFLSCQSNV